MSEPKEPLWITYEQAIAIHSRQLRRFGGAPGLREEGMLRSALERPINKSRTMSNVQRSPRMSREHATGHGERRAPPVRRKPDRRSVFIREQEYHTYHLQTTSNNTCIMQAL